jgi:hypothetical protein
MLRLARTAKTWATRPSSLLAEPDEVRAFLLDEALGVRLQLLELQAAPAARKLPDGLRYAPESIYPPRPTAPVASPHPELLN